MNNDLEWVIEDDSEIDYYLENITSEQFKLDVLRILKMNMDKELLKEIIEKLQSYL